MWLVLPTSVAHADGRGIDLAAPRPADDGFALDVGVELLAPLTLGAHMQLEMPGRELGRFVLGGMPDAIGGAMADAAASLGHWDAGTRASVADALGGALYLEAAIGVRPFPNAGLELAVGYALLWTQTTLSMHGIAAHLETGSHALHATLGYRATFADWMFFRIEAGWLHTVAASASLAVTQPGLVPDGLEAEIEGELTRRGFGPTLSVALGLHLP